MQGEKIKIKIKIKYKVAVSNLRQIVHMCVCMMIKTYTNQLLPSHSMDR